MLKKSNLWIKFHKCLGGINMKKSVKKALLLLLVVTMLTLSIASITVAEIKAPDGPGEPTSGGDEEGGTGEGDQTGDSEGQTQNPTNEVAAGCDEVPEIGDIREIHWRQTNEDGEVIEGVTRIRVMDFMCAEWNTELNCCAHFVELWEEIYDGPNT